MLRMRFFLASLCWFFIAVQGLCEEAHVRIAGTPAWAGEPERADLEAPTPANNPGGWYFLLLDRRMHAELGESYSHIAYRITTSSALQDGAKISVDYDPEYERIDFHFIRVVRGGAASDRLAPSAIKTIQQERDLDRHLYNGQFTALVMLDDIRVDDVVEYAYTRRGRNPIYAGRFHDTVSLQWSTPLRKVSVSILRSPDRELATKKHGQLPVTEATRAVGTLIEQSWTASDVPAVEVDSEVPYWYNAYTFLQFTDYGGWGEVVDWARQLYAIPALSPELAQKTEELTAGLEYSDERALAILNFVQREIRYLGIELGPKSHRPSAPEEVFRRRFGDCKDKALLLCAMLRHVGVDAVPTLTHSYRKETMNEWLPSPDVFDHVIVVLEAVRITYWVDPTFTEQEGKLAYRALPDYRYTLPIAAGVTSLERIKRQANASSALRVEELYDVSSFDDPGRLEVRSHYSGALANSMRVYLRETSADQIAKDYLNNRLRTHPDATADGEVSWTENKATNSLTVTHRYLIPEIWTKPADSSVHTLEIYPAMMRDYTEPPESLKRTMPLAVVHPFSATHETRLTLPRAWPDEDSVQDFNDDAFRASIRTVTHGNSMVITHKWESLKDHVPADRITRYAEKLRSFRESLGCTLTFDTAIAARNENARPYWPLIISLIVTFSVCCAALFWYQRHLANRPLDEPPPLPSSSRLQGLGGWLILVGFGVCVRPFLVLVPFVQGFGQFFEARTTETLTLATSPAHIPGFALLICVEASVNLVLLLGSIWMIVLFFRQHRHFPRVFIAMFTGGLVFQIVDLVAANALLSETTEVQDVKQIFQLVIYCAIWVPYMLVSRRVRATFVR